MNTLAVTASTPMGIRCAVYTRTRTSSSAESRAGIQAQRDAAESYISGHAGDGWVLLPQRYDDKDFSANDLHRPALKRLLRDIKEGKVDRVVVYGMDRMSRSPVVMSQILAVIGGNGASLELVRQPPAPLEVDRIVSFMNGICR